MNKIFWDQFVPIEFCFVNIEASGPDYEHLVQAQTGQMRSFSSRYYKHGFTKGLKKQNKGKGFTITVF